MSDAAPPREGLVRLQIACVLVPVSLYDLALLTVRIFTRIDAMVPRPDRMTAPEWLGLFASPVLVHAGLALLCLGLARVSGKAAVRTAQLFSLLVLPLETLGHSFFLFTGNALDFAQMAFTLSRPRQTIFIAAAGAYPLAGVCLFALLIVAASEALPRLLPPRPETMRRSRRSAVPRLALASLSLAASALPLPLQDLDVRAARDPAVNLAVSALGAARRGGAQRSFAAHVGRFHVSLERARELLPRNIVIVLLESTRAQSVSAYDPALPTTPFFAELARRSLLVERAYAVIPRTTKALVATLCGFEPSHSVKPKTLVLGLLADCLPGLLADRGFATAFFQAIPGYIDDRERTVHEMGFQAFIGPTAAEAREFEHPNQLGPEDESLLAPAARWLQDHPRQPFLATFMTIDAHTVRAPLHRHGVLPLAPDELHNLYLNALRADDFFLRELIDVFKKAGRYEDTVFFVLGDHGEALGEHGKYAHVDIPYEEDLRIPWLVHDPSGERVPPGVVREPRNQLDLLPTALDVLGYRAVGDRPGVSLLKPVPGRPLMASCLSAETCLVRVAGDEKFIDRFGGAPPELYDLRSDPEERINLAEKNPDAVRRARDEVRSWEAQVLAQYWVEEFRRDGAAAGQPAAPRSR